MCICQYSLYSIYKVNFCVGKWNGNRVLEKTNMEDHLYIYTVIQESFCTQLINMHNNLRHVNSEVYCISINNRYKVQS